MNSCRTRALILHVTDHSESDKIITFYSPDIGRATGIAKGAKRSKQRFVNKLEEFSLLNILYRPGKRNGLLFLNEAELENAFLSLRRYYERYVVAMYSAEIVMRFTWEQDPDPVIFSLLLWVMEALENGKDPLQVGTLFHLRILGATGYQPELDRCGSCGITVQSKNKFTLHPGSGFLVCDRCEDKINSSMFSLSVQSLKFLNYGLRSDLNKIDRLRLSRKNAEEALIFLYRYTRHLIQHDINSWHQVKTLFSVYPDNA